MSSNSTYLAGFLVLILTIGTSYGDTINVLPNPGFESGTNPWSGFVCSITTSSDIKRSGNYSGKAYGRTSEWNGLQQNMAGLLQQGKTYNISCWIELENSAVNGDRIYAVIRQKDSRDANDHYFIINDKTGYDGTWTYLSGQFTLDIVGILQSLYLYFSGPAPSVNIYLDDVNVLTDAPGPNITDANAIVDFSTTFQKLDGFGASGFWFDSTVLNYPEPIKTNLINTMFGDLGLDIYRVRNAYDQDGGTDYINNTAEIIAKGESSLGHPIRVMLSSCSPPAYLKSDNNTVGGTLAKDANGNYRYADFAQWWRDSLSVFSAAGVNTYYINMQNEPAWLAEWDTCKWDPTENSTYAGYQQGFAALYANLNTMPNRPLLLAPEHQSISGIENYINALTATDKSNVYGYAHHPYEGSADAPDQLIGEMAAFKAQFGDRPLLMTEFSKVETAPLTWTDAMNLAILMHNFLTIEQVSSYSYWELFWASPRGFVSLTEPNYTVNSVYYAMKHYSKYTDPNWYRVDANTSSSDLRITAYKDPCEPNASIVIINTSALDDINLMISLNNYLPQHSGIYQSKFDANFAYIGGLSTSKPVLLPKQSITTIHLWGLSNCSGLILDSDLNGSCYVDFNDLLIFADNWLNNNCDDSNTWCGGADFKRNGSVNFTDLSDFAWQWKTCNKPGDEDCIQN
jgi:glucuronoarabinoxylan endo-1,4-beta-xylanase